MQAEQADILMREIFPPDAPGAVLTILRRGKFFSQYYGLADLHTGTPIGRETTFRIASLTKQFTARAIRILEAQGAFFPKEPIGRFFPDFPAPLGDITAEQLLRHCSGIADYEVLLAEGRTAPLRDREVETLMGQQGFVYFPPGTAFRYSNTGYCLLARLVEKTSGLPFGRFMDQQVFGPLAMSHSRVPEPGAFFSGRALGHHHDGHRWQRADQGVTTTTQGDGGIYTSAEDYRKWILSGSPGRTVAQRPLAHSLSATLPGEGVGYQDGWFLGETVKGTPCWFHSGESMGFRHMVYGCPTLTLMLFSNGDDHRVDRAFSVLADLLRLPPVLGISSGSLYQWLHQVYQAGSG